MANHRETRLTQQQINVLKLGMLGLSNPLIANRMGITIATVATHKRRMFDKTGVNSFVELVVWWYEYGKDVPVKTDKRTKKAPL